MIDIKTFAVPKEGTTTKYISSEFGNESSTPVNPFEPHYLWGQYFDDTQDIDGDMTVNGVISADKLRTINLETENSYIGKAYIDEADISTLNSYTGVINNLSGVNLNYQLATIVAAYIKELSSDEITTENLTVTKSAHFFELIIDKIKAAGGAILLTPADGFVIDSVLDVSGGKKLLFRANDGEKAIRNMWQVNDQAICQTFNQAQIGTNYNVSNKYWWSLVTAVGTETINDEDYHYIVVSTTTKDGTLNPEAGDEVAMLGYRGTNDPNRQSAIYISAYASLDDELVAPLICQYRGINDFDLASHKYTWFASGVTAKGQSNNVFSNEIRGNLRMSSGQSVEDAISGGQSVDITSYKILLNTTSIKNGDTIKPSTLTATLLKNHNGETTELSTVPTGLNMKLYGVTGNSNSPLYTWYAGNAISMSTTNLVTYDYLYMLLSDGSTAYDRASISIVADGQDGQDGSASVNGGHWVFAYKPYKPRPDKPTPDKPTGTGNSDGWSTDPSTPDYANGEYLWMSQCFVSGTGDYDIWTNPIRFTGDNGRPGEDGNKTEFIYAVNTSTTTPPDITYTPNRNKTRDDDDFAPIGWEDNPQGVKAQNQVEWVSTRIKIGSAAWGDFAPPAIWSKWGEKGTDGDGYEYIFKGSNYSSASDLTKPNSISQPSSSSEGLTKDDDGFVPEGWSNQPVQLSPSVLYEYVSVRKKTSQGWQPFSTPKLWAQWSAPGSNGQDGNTWVFIYNNSKTKPNKPNDHVGVGALPEGWHTEWTEPDYDAGEYVWMSQTEVIGNVYGIWSEPIRLTGQNGKAGEDGTKIEFIYKRSTANNITSSDISYSPYNNKTRYDDDFVPEGWTDNPTGVDETNQYEWVATREKNNGIWSTFSTPAIWSKWGEKGMDGDGYEYIYTRLQQGQMYMIPTPLDWETNTDYQSSEREYIPTGWYDDPVSPSQQFPTVYVSVRKRRNGVWQPFSTPSIWARWIEGGTGQDGQDGQDGENAKQDLMLDCGSYCTITYDGSTQKYTLTRQLSVYVYHHDGNTMTPVTTQDNYSIWWRYNNTSTYTKLKTGDLNITSDGKWETNAVSATPTTKLSSIPQYAVYQLRNANGSVMYDQLVVYSKMATEAVIAVARNEINIWVSDVESKIGDSIINTLNAVSSLQIRFDNITATIAGVLTTYGIDGTTINSIEDRFTQIEASLEGFRSTVYSKTEVNGLITETQSMIDQKADEISLSITNQLRSTGINITDGIITLNADKTVINGNLILQQNGNNEQGLIFRHANDEDGLKLTTDAVPALSTFVNDYSGYTRMIIGTNGFAWQTGNSSSTDRYLYVTSNDITLYSDSHYGKNNEGKTQIRIPLSGGQTGEIIDYIGDMNQSQAKTWYADLNSTTNVSFVESNVKVQHNGVRCVRLPSNATAAYYTFIPSSKDKVLLCYPTNGHRIRIDVGATGAIGNGSNIGHTYYIKIMPRASSNVKVELFGATFLPGDRDLENTLSTTFNITDNCIYTVIVLGNSEAGTTQYALVGRMQSGSYT